MERKFIGRVIWLAILWLVLTAAEPAKKSDQKVKQVVIKEVTRVEGKIQKPEVWYLLPRSELNFEGLKLEDKLTPKIEKSVNKAPF